jgi:magnesium transporter
MLKLYAVDGDALRVANFPGGAVAPEGPLWFDLLNPTGDERDTVAAAVGAPVPTREEMEEIEVSSRLREEDEVLYLTATVISGADTTLASSGAVTFMLKDHRLVTIRYEDPKPFNIVSERLSRLPMASLTGETILITLLDAIIDRLADVLERQGADIESISRGIFHYDGGAKPVGAELDELMRRIGRAGDMTARARESLVSIARLLLFVINSPQVRRKHVGRERFKTLHRDVTSLADHATFLANKVSFLLDATLGMINIEQTGIIKIFSVAAVVLLPPTVIASIYGMNFVDMPELHWGFGYPFALGLMVLSAIVPYLWFKRKGWL